MQRRRPFLACALGALLLSSVAPCAVAADRQAVSGTPTLAGRPIERFVLLAPIVVPAAKIEPGQGGFLLLAGQYVPVAQDAEGVFFQSRNGIRRGYGDEGLDDGGVWVSKTKGGVMVPYSGRAAKLSEPVLVRWNSPLPLDDMRQFRTASAQKGDAKAPRKAAGTK